MASGVFGPDVVRGFLPANDPIAVLPSTLRAWDEVGTELPKLLVSSRLRSELENLPAADPEELAQLSDAEAERVMLLLSYFGHAYVWGASPPGDRLPRAIAIPWHAVASRLGRPPVLSYASYALYNWRRFDVHAPVELGNIALLQNFWGGADEEWFILVHVAIEQTAAPAIAALRPLRAATREGDVAGLARHLGTIAAALGGVNAVMDRMPDLCDPYMYYRRVRPYIFGWKDNPALPDGLTYEGVSAYVGPQMFRGETGAQSSIIPALDAALGITHADDALRQHLVEMREYMPPAHRAFISEFETDGSTLRSLVDADTGSVASLYDECVGWVEQFRSTHLEYAARYIQRQSQSTAANPTAVGTGGTPFMQYLKKHRDETADQRLRP